MDEEIITIPVINLTWTPWTTWEQVAAAVDVGGARIPSRPGVYEVKVDVSGDYLHIGRASNLYARVRQGLVRGKLPHSTGERIRTTENVATLMVRWAVTDRPVAVEEELHRRYREANGGKLPKHSRST